MATIGTITLAKGDIYTTAHKQCENLANDGYGVITGCDVHQKASPGMGVTVDAGTILFNGVYTVVGGGDLTIDTSDVTYPRFDVIYVNITGTALVSKGTAAAILPTAETAFKKMHTPSPNASLPIGVVLARVYVAASATSILNASIDDMAMNAAHIPMVALTTRGDLLARDANVPKRLAVGAINTILSSDGTDPSWGLTKVTTIGVSGSDSNLPTEQAVREEFASLGVTNGNSHDHSGGDGAQIDHTTLSNKGTKTHTQIDTFISNLVTTVGNPGTDTNFPSEQAVREAIDSLNYLQKNYVWNSSFEYVLGTHILGWTTLGTATVSSTGSTLITRDGYHIPPTGNNGLVVAITSAGTGNEGISQTLKNLKASTTYTFRCYAAAASGDTAKAWTTGAGTNLSITSSATSWTAITGTFITDATPTDVVLKLGSATSTDIVYFDQVTMSEGIDVPVTYFCDIEWDAPKQLQFGAGSGDSVIDTGVIAGSFKQSQDSYEVLGWKLIESSATPLATATVVMDVLKKSSYAPTGSDSICASAKPGLTTVTNAESATLTGWTKTINKGDWLGAEVETNDLAKCLDLILIIRRL